MRQLEIFLKVIFVILSVKLFLDNVLSSPYLAIFIVVSFLLGIVLMFNKQASYNFKQTKRDIMIRRVEGVVLVAFSLAAAYAAYCAGILI